MSTAQSKLTCLCGAVSEPGSLLTASKFPITAGLCNCNACRHSVGTMGCSSVLLKSSPSEKSIAACSSYKANETMTRYFCATCGTKIFFHTQRGGSSTWLALPGVIERSDMEKVDTIRINQTWYVSDTKDGGLARRIMENMSTGAAGSPQKDEFAFYAEGRPKASKIPFDQVKTLWIESPETTDASGSLKRDKVTASCHCGAVQIMVCRPDPAKHDLRSLQKYLRQDNTKYTAALCTCRSCRLATGLPLQPWTYIMPENILTKSGQQVDFDFGDGLNNLPGLATFRSTKNVRRSFCRTCGATFFFEQVDRPEVIDISMGLFRSSVGAMATDFFEWNWDAVSYREECRVEGYLQMLVGPLKPKLSKF